MQSLYKNGLEHVYDEMYQTFINYADEYQFYSNIIKNYQKSNVLEIGCGTGNLAKYFIDSDLNYMGLDKSKEMITLSKHKNPEGIFTEGDVTDFKLAQPVDSILITGRTTSYLTTNRSINKALTAIHENLKANGILCFDFIDANRFIKVIKEGIKVVHEAHFNNNHYIRESYMNWNPSDNLMFDWAAVYFKKVEDKRLKIAEDTSTVRAFTKNEWELFLYLNKFELIEFIDRKSYAFDTYVVVAKKID